MFFYHFVDRYQRVPSACITGKWSTLTYTEFDRATLLAYVIVWDVAAESTAWNFPLRVANVGVPLAQMHSNKMLIVTMIDISACTVNSRYSGTICYTLLECFH